MDLRIRIRASWTMSSTRKPRSCACTCRPMPIACCPSWIIVCAAATMSMSSSPASTRRRSGCRWKRRSIHCSEGIGIWQWASNDQSSEPDVVMACAGDVPTLETLGGGFHPAARIAQFKSARRERGRPHEAAAAIGTPAWSERQRFRCLVHHEQAGDFRLPWLSLAHPSIDISPYTIMMACMCAAIKKRARLPRHLTWRFSTTWIGFIW